MLMSNKGSSGASPVPLRRRRRALAAGAAIIVGIAAAFVPGGARAQTKVDQPVAFVLINDPQFKTTAQLIYMTGYVNSLRKDITVFAPTEAGWDTGDHRSFLAYQDPMSTRTPQASAVVKLLRGLAVSGIHPPAQFTSPQTLQTIGEGAVTVNAGATEVTWKGKGGAMQGARVVGSPILAADGIIYPVDGVVGQ